MILDAARVLNTIFGAGVNLGRLGYRDGGSGDFRGRRRLIRVRIERLSNRITGRALRIDSLGLRIFLCRFAQRIMNTAHFFMP